jgi:hypothetical protein
LRRARLRFVEIGSTPSMTDRPPLTRDARSVVDWLIDGARTEHTPQDVLAELCDRLVAGGLPLHRVAVFVRTLHPNVMGRRFLWRRGQAVQVTERPHAMLEEDTYLQARSRRSLAVKAPSGGGSSIPSARTTFVSLRSCGVRESPIT